MSEQEAKPDLMMTQASLARALDVAPRTVRDRIKAGIIVPDGTAGTAQRPIRLFRSSRLPALRALVRGEQIVA